MLKRHQPEVTLQETAELLDKMQASSITEPVVLALIREQLQIHNTTQRGMAHSLHDINNSIQTLASAVRNLEK